VELAMKITVDVDITPEELRRFLGLPNVEKIQEQLLKNAQNYLKESGDAPYGEFVAQAMQPMMAYQQWLSGLMNGSTGSSKSKSKTKKPADPDN